jgi:Holliday junction resolvase RusA-like endonuclease
MQEFECLIPKRPVSLQTKSRKNLQSWKNYIGIEARKIWGNMLPIEDESLRVSIIYLCDDSPADIDNIIKPIQDALVGIIFQDDSLVSDVDSHRRFLDEPINLVGLPPLLQAGAVIGKECIYIKVSTAEDLENYL